MRDVISCPGCGRKLRFSEDLVGALVACPSCGRSFTATAELQAPGAGAAGAASPLPGPDPERVTVPQRPPTSGERPGPGRYPDEDEDAPFRLPPISRLPPCPPEEVPAWTRVRRGIGWMLVGIMAPFGVWLLLFVFCLLPGSRGPADTVPGLYLIFFVAHVVPEFVGQVDCTAVPGRGGARPLAVAGLILYALLVLFGIVQVFSSISAAPRGYGGQRGSPLDPSEAFGLFVGLLGAARYFVWLFYLRAVARRVAPKTLARSISTLMVLAGVTAGLLVFVTALPAVTMRVSGTAMAALCSGCSVAVLVPIVAIWTLVDMFQVRSAVGSYLRGRAWG